MPAPSDALARATARLMAQQARLGSVSNAMQKALGAGNARDVAKMARQFETLTENVQKTIVRVGTLTKSTRQSADSTNQLNRSWQTLGQSVTSVVRAGLIGGTILAATMKEAMSHWNPAAVTRFEQRLGDLGAVIGEVVAPAFQELTNDIKSIADYILNLDPSTKKMISNFIRLAVPIMAIGLALSGMIALFRPLVTIGVVAVNMLAQAWTRVAIAATAANVAQNAAQPGVGRAGMIGGTIGGVAGGIGGLYAAQSMGMGQGGQIAMSVGGAALGTAVGSAGVGGLVKGGGAIGKGLLGLGRGIGNTTSSIIDYIIAQSGTTALSTGIKSFGTGAASMGLKGAGGAAAAGGLGAMGLTAGLATYGIDWMMHPKDRLTTQHFSDAWEDFGTKGRRASALSPERNERNNAAVNEARVAAGLVPLGPDGKQQPKDSTGYDAQRKVTTSSSVLDAGRRLREQAITSGGRLDPNEKTATAVQSIDDKLNALMPGLMEGQNTQKAIDARMQQWMNG